MPKFSIIIPVYNVAPYLAECLDSVKAQDFLSWEAICINDGSTDGSAEILNSYMSKDRRFRVFSQVNSGVSAARNLALSHARGTYVVLLDGDDAIHPDFLGWLAKVLEEHPCADGLMFTRAYVGNEKPTSWDPLPEPNKVYVSDKCDSVTYAAARQTGVTTIYKNARIGLLRFDPELRMSEDTLFAIEYYWQSKQWIVSDCKPYFYRKREGSARSSPITLRVVNDWLRAENEMADLFIRNSDRWMDDGNGSGMVTFLKWNRNMIWFTLDDMYFRLPPKEMRICLSAWMALQKKYAQLYKPQKYRRMILLVCADLLKSVILLKVMIVGQRWIYLKASAVKGFLMRLYR